MKILNAVLLLIAGAFLVYNVYQFGFTLINTSALILLIISVIANISRQRREKKAKEAQELNAEKKSALQKKTGQQKK